MCFGSGVITADGIHSNGNVIMDSKVNKRQSHVIAEMHQYVAKLEHMLLSQGK